MDFIQGLDPSRLVFAATVCRVLPRYFSISHQYVSQALSFALSPFASPPYNLAIFLFGTYAQENREAIQSLQMV